MSVNENKMQSSGNDMTDMYEAITKPNIMYIDENVKQQNRPFSIILYIILYIIY